MDETKTAEEHELIQQFLKGDQSAFDKLMTRHQKRVYRIALGMLGDHDEAADITQEAFIRVFRSLKNFKFGSRFGTWLHRITVNLCISHLRQQRLRQHLSLSEVSHLLKSPFGRPARDLDLKDLAQHIEEAIATLPPKQRAIFVMHYHEEMPHKEIANIMNRSEGAIKSSYCQAVKKLRKRLMDHGKIES